MDRIFEAFLKRQLQEGTALAESSDLLDLLPVQDRLLQPFVEGDSPTDPEDAAVSRYIARFCCKGLVREGGGAVIEADRFDVGIWFPSDYLRRVVPFQVLTWMGPRNVYHPNISDQAPFICVGHLAPGTPLVDILYQCFEIITFNKVTMREDDALNKDACAWARHNQHRFPIDSRPLKRRTLAIRVEAIE